MANRCLSADRYTIGLALRDALMYHSACAMDVGIAESSKAMADASRPGLEGLAAAAAAASKVGALQTISVNVQKNRREGGFVEDKTNVGATTSEPVAFSGLNAITDCANVGRPEVKPR